MEAATTSKNMVGVMVLKLVQIFCAVLFAAVIPRTMGPKFYGMFAFLISITAVVGAIVNLAVGATFGRFFPEYEAQGKINLIHKLFSNMLVLKTIFTFFVCLILYAVLQYFYTGHYPFPSLIIVALIVLFNDWETIIFAVLYGFNKMSLFSLREPVKRFLGVLLVVVLFHFYGFIGALSASIIVSFVVLAVGVFLSKAYIRFSISSINLTFLKPFLKFGITTAVIWSFINLWRAGGNILINAVSMDSSAVAYFDIAQRIYDVSSSVSFIMINSLVPIFTTLLVTNKSVKIIAWCERISRYTCILNMLGLSIFVVFGFDIIHIVIGDEYDAVYPIAVILLLSIFPFVITQIGYTLSIVYKRQLHYLIALLVSFSIFTIMSILLIPKLSAVGCAIASIISFSIMAVLIAFTFREKMMPSLITTLKVVLVGAMLSPLFLIKGDMVIRVGTLVAFAGSFLLILFALKQLNFKEVEEVISSLRHKKTI